MTQIENMGVRNQSFITMQFFNCVPLKCFIWKNKNQSNEIPALACNEKTCEVGTVILKFSIRNSSKNLL